MKKLILLALMSTFAMSDFSTLSTFNAQEQDLRLCKTSIRDAHAYQASMSNSEADKATLDAHKEKVVAHCGTLVAKS